MAADPTFAGTPKRGLVTIVPGDTTTLKTLLTAGASGSKLVALFASSDDTADKTVQVWITRGGTDYLLCSALVADLSGTNGATDPTVDLLANLIGDPRDNDGQRYQFLESGDVLKVKVTAAVTTNKIYCHAVWADF